MKTGTANLPLHGGKCPAWLFKHMKALCAAIIEVIVEEYGTGEVLKRLSNPYWFQALGCVAGFDWHSSGLTTTVCGALKEGLHDISPSLGIFFAGGKGRTARNTPLEIKSIFDRYSPIGDPDNLIYCSKMAAKVDSAAVQDNYQIYHHFFVFTNTGAWAVIQQGMNDMIRFARRYHWCSNSVDKFTIEPHSAICCNAIGKTLNLVSSENISVQDICTEMSTIPAAQTLKELEKIQVSKMQLNLPSVHKIPRTSYLNKSLNAAYEHQVSDFEQLLAIPGIGPGTLRALCLVAEVAYGAAPSYNDPVRYSFAHGGKDGFPFPVNENDIHTSYITLKRAVKRARLGNKAGIDALNRLAAWHSQINTPVATPAQSMIEIKESPITSSRSSDIIQPSLF